MGPVEPLPHESGQRAFRIPPPYPTPNVVAVLHGLVSPLLLWALIPQ
jgi:hypothetical protein